MAPVVKVMSSSGFIYEWNNFVALVNTTSIPQEIHGLMDFINGCKLSYAMLEAPIIYCEVVEKIWTSATYDSGNKVLNFILKIENYFVNSGAISACLHLPKNNCLNGPSDASIVTMLQAICYSPESNNLDRIRRKGLKKIGVITVMLLSRYFIVKSVILNITNSMLVMLNMLLNDQYFNFGELVLIEITAKLGIVANRPRNIYYTRFFMLLANYVTTKLEV